jgi:hypothetical protein
VCVCVCVRVCARARGHMLHVCLPAKLGETDTHRETGAMWLYSVHPRYIYTHTHIHTCIHTCVCVCLCVCVYVCTNTHTEPVWHQGDEQRDTETETQVRHRAPDTHTHTHATHTHTHLGIPQPIHAMFTAASTSSSIAAAPPSHTSSFAAPHPSSDPPTPSENNSDAPKVGDERVVTEAPGEGDAAMLACARSGKPWTALEDQLLFRCATAVEEGRAMGETEAGARAPSTDVRSPPPRSRAPARESVLSS